MVAFSTDIHVFYAVNRTGSYPVTSLLLVYPISFECTRREYNISNFVNFNCDLTFDLNKNCKTASSL